MHIFCGTYKFLKPFFELFPFSVFRTKSVKQSLFNNITLHVQKASVRGTEFYPVSWGRSLCRYV